MKKIEAVIQPFKFDEVKTALLATGVEGMTISEVKGIGHEKGHHEFYRGREFTVNVLPKMKLEIVCSSDRVDLIVKTLKAAAKTGESGDGKIFITSLDEVYRIRTEDTAELAV